MRPLFKTNVPHPAGHGSTFMPRKDVGAMGWAPAACWRILTTSNGVTVRAVTMEPMEPERIRGMRGDDTSLVVDDVVVWSFGEARLPPSLLSDGDALSLFILKEFIRCLLPKSAPLLL